MKRVDCSLCHYGSGSGLIKYCGLGLSKVDGACSTYIHRDEVVVNNMPALRKVPGCFLPVHKVTDIDVGKGTRIVVKVYTILLPVEQELTPSYSLMRNTAPLLRGIRYELRSCLFEEDYGGRSYRSNTLYTDWWNSKLGGTVSYNLMGLDVRVDSSPFKVSLYLSLVNEGNQHYQGLASNPEYDLPPHYWWLDVTAPYEQLLPMHNLIRAYYSNTVQKYEPHYGGRELNVLRHLLVLGLEHKGMPPDGGVPAIRELEGLSPHAEKWARKGFTKALLREWCTRNAIRGI